MLFDDCIIECQIPGFRWALLRRKDRGTYFFIADLENTVGMVPMIELYWVDRNYFKCRSIAIAMYRSFASKLIE